MSSLSLVIICLLDYNHPGARDMISCCGFDFISLMVNDSENVIGLLSMYMSSLDKLSSDPLPPFNWAICLFAIEM